LKNKWRKGVSQGNFFSGFYKNWSKNHYLKITSFNNQCFQILYISLSVEYTHTALHYIQYFRQEIIFISFILYIDEE